MAKASFFVHSRIDHFPCFHDWSRWLGFRSRGGKYPPVCLGDNRNAWCPFDRRNVLRGRLLFTLHLAGDSAAGSSQERVRIDIHGGARRAGQFQFAEPARHIGR